MPEPGSAVVCKPDRQITTADRQILLSDVDAKTAALRGNKPNRPPGQVIFHDQELVLISVKKTLIFRVERQGGALRTATLLLFGTEESNGTQTLVESTDNRGMPPSSD